MVNDKVNSLENRVNNLEQDRSELSKLSAIMEIQVEMNKDQDKFLREQSSVIIKMNENLTTLNEVTYKLDGRMGDLEDRVIQNTIDGLKSSIDEEKSNSINVPQLIKNILVTAVTTIAVSIIIYLVANGVTIK